MSADVIDGRELARIVRQEVAAEVAKLATPPGLATVLVGDDPASEIYVASKRKLCVAAGMNDLHRHLPGSASQVELERVVDELNADEQVDGILVQLPLPDHLDAAAIIARIHPDKDIDGLTETSAGRLALGRPGLRPCTPSGVNRLLEWAGVEVKGAHAVVVGRSDLVGKPQAQLLLAGDATVTTCHRHTADLASHTSRADILVVAAGVGRLVGPEHVKPGATVIDVGMHRTDNGLCGDVDFERVREVAGRITPVPGGVGPMTIASLLQNTVTAATLRRERA